MEIVPRIALGILVLQTSVLLLDHTIMAGMLGLEPRLVRLTVECIKPVMLHSHIILIASFKAKKKSLTINKLTARVG